MFPLQHNHIHAMVASSIAPKFKSQLYEGNVYIFSNFSVFRADKGYRPVTNELVIRFNASTTCTFVPEPVPNIASYKFEFVPFEDIHQRYPLNVQLCGNTSQTYHFMN